MQDNHGDDMYAIELVPMGRFEAEQNGIYKDDPLAERMPLFAILEDNPVHILQDGREIIFQI